MAGKPALPVQSPVQGCLRLSIDGPGSFKVDKAVDSLHSAGRYEFGRVDFEVSAPISLPSSGDYTFRLRNCEDVSATYHYGAMVTFERHEKPTEGYLARVAMRGLSWLLLAAGLMVAVWGEIRTSVARNKTA